MKKADTKPVAYSDKNCAPSENLALDEFIRPFKGRTGNKVYCKAKINKYGVKLYASCYSSSSYLLDTQTVGEQEKLSDLVLNWLLRMQMNGVFFIWISIIFPFN